MEWFLENYIGDGWRRGVGAPSPGDCWAEGKGRRVFNSGMHTKVRGAGWVWGGRQRGRSYPVQVNGAAVVPALLTIGFPWRLHHLLVVQPQHCHHLICTNTTHRYWVIQRFHHLQWMWIVHGCVWWDDCCGLMGWNGGMDRLWLIFGGWGGGGSECITVQQKVQFLTRYVLNRLSVLYNSNPVNTPATLTTLSTCSYSTNTFKLL